MVSERLRESIDNRLLHRAQSKTEYFVPTVNRTSVVVDSYDGAQFNINEAGFIRNDISALERCESDSLRQSLLRRLQDTEDVRDSNDTLPIKDRLDLIRPRYCQSMSELEAYASVVAQYDVDKMHDAYMKSLDDVNVAKDAKSDSNQSSATAAPAAAEQ